MENLSIVTNVDCLQEHLQIAREYNVAFELNDFFDPAVLDDDECLERIVAAYQEAGIPQGSTMHGVFYDIVPFSLDARIREISIARMLQSMEVANKIQVTGVVFHTNANPDIFSEEYISQVVNGTVQVLKMLLEQYPDMNIYLENMFDRTPTILERISKQLVEYKNYGVCLDWAHACLYGDNVDEWVKSLYPYVKHIHINDHDGKKDCHWALGQGVLEWPLFFDYYRKFFGKCSVLIETTEPKKQIESLEFLKQIEKGDGIMNGMQTLNSDEMLEAIFDCMNRLAVEQDLETAIFTLTELGKTLVHSDRASFWYWDMPSKKYWTIAALGRERIVIPEKSGIVGASIENGQSIVINDPYNDERFNPQVDKETGYRTQSILCIPVYNTAGEVIGAIQAINKLSEDGFGEQDIRRLTLAATFSGKILETHLLRTQNQIDALTGLKNRKGFYEYYDKSIVPCLENGQATIVMCDIDHFKQVNDQYGHNAGDAVLCKVAGTLTRCFKECGEAFRWGGEEFIVLLKTDKTHAASLAEQTRQELERSICTFENIDIHITMSFGVWAIDGELNAEKNVQQADDLLYLAKKSGRNRVEY